MRSPLAQEGERESGREGQVERDAVWLVVRQRQGPRHCLHRRNCRNRCYRHATSTGIGGAPVIVHGKSFLGHFLGGKKHGSGLHSFYDGSFYQGEYSEGLYHGNGH